MTILSVDFIPRRKAEVLTVEEATAVISINEPESGMAPLAAFPEILRLAFHDVDSQDYADWVLFDEAQGQEVIGFVERLHASPIAHHLKVHCRAGISRSAAVALYVAEATGCEFQRRPFAGLANKLMLEILSRASGLPLKRPRALPRRERFQVEISRDFETGLAEVRVVNRVTQEETVQAGPMLEVPQLLTAGLQQVWGIANPPSAHHVTNWDHLEG